MLLDVGPFKLPGREATDMEVMLWHRPLRRSASESGTSCHGPKEGAITSGGHGLQGNPVQVPDSPAIPTSIPSEFPRIAFSGRALGQDAIDAAIQTTSTSKVRRVDFGGCGPPQPPVGKQPPDPSGGCRFLRGPGSRPAAHRPERVGVRSPGLPPGASRSRPSLAADRAAATHPVVAACSRPTQGAFGACGASRLSRWSPVRHGDPRASFQSSAAQLERPASHPPSQGSARGAWLVRQGAQSCR